MNKLGAAIFLGLAGVFFGIGIFNIVTINSEANSIRAEIAQLISEEEDMSREIEKLGSGGEIPDEEVESRFNKAKELGEKIAKYENELNLLNDGDTDRILIISDDLTKMIATDDYVKHRWYYTTQESGCKWEFSTLNGLISRNMPVMWTLKDKDGKLVAFVNATYDSDNEIFTGFSTTFLENYEKHFNGSNIPEKASANVDRLNLLTGKYEEGGETR